MKIPAHIIYDRKKRDEEARRRRDEELHRLPLKPPAEPESDKKKQGPKDERSPRKIVVVEL